MEKDSVIMYKKKAPDIFLEPFRKALSYFPELRDIFVFVHETHLFGVQHTLRAYPPLTVLHWRKSKWVYPIVINQNKDINNNQFTYKLYIIISRAKKEPKKMNWHQYQQKTS